MKSYVPPSAVGLDPSTMIWAEPWSPTALMVNIRLQASFASQASPNGPAGFGTCYPFSSRNWALDWLDSLKRQHCQNTSHVSCHQKDCLRGKCFNATNTPNHISSHVFPYISSAFYFICFGLFPLQAGELGLLAAIPVCVLVVYQTADSALTCYFFPSWCKHA